MVSGANKCHPAFFRVKFLSLPYGLTQTKILTLMRGRNRLIGFVWAVVLLCATLLGPPGVAWAGSDGTEVGSIEVAQCPFDRMRSASPGLMARAGCGYLIAPQDHTQLDSPTIKLFFMQVKTANPNPQPDPIIFLEGGPGASGVETMGMLFDRAAQTFFESRDLITFDQRGTGDSIPSLRCPEYSDLLVDSFTQSAGTGQVGANVGEQRNEALLACRTRWIDEGVDLTTYHTVQNAADVDLLRRALGYDQVNLWGISYGTQLALSVIRNYPDGVRSAVLEAVVPPQVNLFTSTSAALDRALNKLFSACAADSACNRTYPKLGQKFYEMADKLAQKPVQLTLDHPITGEPISVRFGAGEFLGAVQLALYNTRALSMLPFQIRTADRNNTKLFENYFRAALMGGETLATGMRISTLCADEAAFTSAEEIDASFNTGLAVNRILGGGSGAAQIKLCRAWKPAQLGPWADDPVVSDIPTLLYMGEFDPVAPPEWGRMAAKTLTHSYPFEWRGYGHGITNSGDACPIQMMQDFLDAPNLRPSDACMSDLPNVKFFTPSRFK